MLEVLRRFEEEARDEDALLGDDGEEEDDDLTRRLGSVDLGAYPRIRLIFPADERADFFTRFGLP